MDETCFGINLVDGSSWSVPADRIFCALGDLVQLATEP
jgi:hypothetical protein